MNLLELDIRNESDLDNDEYVLVLKIDGEEFLGQIGTDLNIAYFNELNKSITENGSYLIFTCSCGIADCGGWDKVKVIHFENSIQWQFEYENNYKFKFDKNLYIGEIKRMEFELKLNNTKMYPQNIIDPE